MDVTASQKAKEALEQAVHARDEFLSIASHELKTPLTSMRLYAQSVARHLARSNSTVVERSRVQAFVDSNDRQVERLSRLVDDMLDVSRIKAGKLVLRREHCVLTEIVGDVVERLAAQFEDVCGSVPAVPAIADTFGFWDRARLEQVAGNVLTNALRYGKGAPVEITIEPDAAAVRFSVRDRGIGIAPEFLDRLFNRFERAP